MVNETTKRIILVMTIIVIIVMAYLVHSPKFLNISDDGKITFKVNKKSKIKISNNKFYKKRPKNKEEYNSIKHAQISSKVKDNRPKVKIGISLPLSEDGGIFGNAIKQSLELALQDIPEDTKYRYEIVVEDDSKDKSVYTNTQRLIENEKVDALLSVGNNEAYIVAGFADRYKLPHITCSFESNVLKNSEYTLNHSPTIETRADAFLENLDNNNIRIFSIVSNDTPYIVEIVDEVEKKARIDNYPLLSKSVVKRGTSDFSKIINQIDETKPEAVMVMLEPEELDVFAEGLNKTKNNFVYTSIDLLHNYYNRSLVEGAVFVTSSDGDYKFKEDFRKNSVFQIPLCAPQLYDAVKMIAFIYEQTDETKPKGIEIVKRLKTIESFPSATNDDIDVNDDGTIDSPMIGMKIEKGILKYQ